MRKRQKGAILKKGGPRVSVARSLVAELIIYGEVKTNWSWAKAIQPRVDRLVSLVKREKVGGLRQVAKFLGNKRGLGKRLAEVIVPQLGERVSGYTRVVRMGERSGDGVMVGRISWVVEIKEPELAVDEKGEKKTEKKDQPGADKEKK